MALIRTYFTYIPQFVKNSDYPGGAWIRPYEVFSQNFGGTETMHEDQMFVEHYQGQDCRRLAWVEGDDQHISNGSTETVSEFIVAQGLQSFNAKKLTIEDALTLARVFSPSRTVEYMDPVTSTSVTKTIQECQIVDGLITQEIV